MLYSCTHMATVGFKGLKLKARVGLLSVAHNTVIIHILLLVLNVFMADLLCTVCQKNLPHPSPGFSTCLLYAHIYIRLQIFLIIL